MVLQKVKNFFSKSLWRTVVAGLIVAIFVGIVSFLIKNTGTPPTPPPEISITNVPPLGFVPNQMEDIAGEVRWLRGSAYTDCAVVIYAYTENPPGKSPWSVQPTYDSPLTQIGSNGRWNNRTHRGSKYAAILVKKPYEPHRVLDALPTKSGNILDIKIVEEH